MKVFLLHYYSAISNPAYQQITTGLRSLGHEVVLGYRSSNDDLILDSGTNSQQTIAAPEKTQVGGLVGSIINKYHFLCFVFRIRKFIREWQPGAVQLNRSNLDWHWVLPLFTNKTTVFIQDCRQVETPTYARNPIKAAKQYYRYLTHILFIKHVFDHATYLHARGAKKELGDQWQRYASIVPLGVGQEFIDTKPPATDNNRKNNVFSFLYIGSITRYRKLELLVEAAAALKTELGSCFKLDFVGPDNSQGYYQQLVQSLGADDVIDFLGHKHYHEIPALIYKHQVSFAYVPYEPQDWSYQPTLKILEYLALGVPVLATDVAPNLEIVNQYHNGLVVENTVTAWKNAMARYVTDTEYALKCRENAEQHRRGTPWQAVAQLYIDVYQKSGTNGD